MAELYAQLIRDGKKTLEEVPGSLREEVRLLLVESGDLPE